MLLLVAMVALVTVAIFFRYVVDASLTWYDEFASYLMVWLSFYGAVAATWRGRHINFETLADRVRPSTRRLMNLVSELLSLVFQGVLLVYGVVLVQAVGHETAVSLESVRMGWIYSVLPISGGLMFLVTLVRLAALLRGEAPTGHVQPPAAAGTATE
jgi:TRAP-type C4-dicarboxylate transport system permease small subunit